MAETNYPEFRREILSKLGKLGKELPAPMSAFGQLHKSSTMTEGELSVKHKALIALGISLVVRCRGCITSHLDDALKAGATRAEVIECLGVAITMGGGPAAMEAMEALDALNQFEAQRGG